MTKNLAIIHSRPGLRGDALPSLSRSKDQPAEHKNTRPQPLVSDHPLPGSRNKGRGGPDARRAGKVERDIPLYLIARVVKREVSTHGEDLSGS